MATAQDVALTIGKEAAYGTPVTVSRSLPVLGNGSLNFRPKREDSAAFRYGARLQSSAGRVMVTSDVGGEEKFELGTRDFGLLWNACFGAVTSTLVPASAPAVYQQNHTIGDPLPSLTVQKLLPSLNADATFSDSVFTFDGVMVKSWTLDVPNRGIATLALTLDGRNVTMATPKVAPVYAAANHLLHFGGACLHTGTITAPTATAVASAATPVANVKSITISGDNALSDDPYLFCGNGKKSRKPQRGRMKVSGTLAVEYRTDGPFVAAFLNDTSMTMLLNLAALENADEQVQVILTEVKIEGDLPQAGGDPGVIELKVPFTAYQNAAGDSPITVVNRTYDTAV